LLSRSENKTIYQYSHQFYLVASLAPACSTKAINWNTRKPSYSEEVSKASTNTHLCGDF